MNDSRTLYMIRHGESRSNAGEEHSEGIDPSLTRAGEIQARETGRYLTENCAIDTILCSPFRRCIQTAYPISLGKGVPITLEPLLHEFFNETWFGDIRKLRFPSLKKLEGQYTAIEGKYTDTRWWPNIAERETDVQDRVSRLLDRLMDSSSSARHIVCVGHWATVAAMTFHFDPEANLPAVHNGALTKIICSPDGHRIEQLNFNEHHSMPTPEYS